MNENYFERLYNIDVSEKLKTKNNLLYLSWSACWKEVKSVFPDATFTIYEQPITITDTSEGRTIVREVKRPWFDDGNTGWVKTGVTINGIEHIEDLPIMDFKNKSIPAKDITSSDANKSIQRSLTKACARHGIALWIYEGEDLAPGVKAQKKAQESKLKTAKNALIELMGSLIEGGVNKDEIYAIVSKHNGGKKNPTSITNAEVCEKIMADIKKKYKESK